MGVSVSLVGKIFFAHCLTIGAWIYIFLFNDLLKQAGYGGMG